MIPAVISISRPGLRSNILKLIDDLSVLPVVVKDPWLLLLPELTNMNWRLRPKQIVIALLVFLLLLRFRLDPILHHPGIFLFLNCARDVVERRRETIYIGGVYQILRGLRRIIIHTQNMIQLLLEANLVQRFVDVNVSMLLGFGSLGGSEGQILQR